MTLTITERTHKITIYTSRSSIDVARFLVQLLLQAIPKGNPMMKPIACDM
ncbi:MAG: hypothetical protein FGF53_07240 [Candidatus Brockarchaeota archaeon]|nr:hypothetical protein [Candidatus Brockarchaeota archaeon]MBS7625978.1 hypothetical protein [Candidatus Bathyarchaeota archaeon]